MADSLFLSTLKASRRQKYGDLDIKEFSQMFKEGAVDKIPADLAYHLIRYRPQNDDELSLWIYACLEKQGLSPYLTRLPNHLQTDLKGTCSHLDFLGDVLFDRVQDCIVLGGRGQSKTICFALALFLEAYFKPGIELAHLGAIEDQAKRCYRYFRKIVEHPLFVGTLAKQASGSRAEFANGSLVEILVGTVAGVNGPHPSRTQIDEVELMDWAILQEAFNMARDSKGYKGATRLTSTRKKNSGTMQKIIDEAEERGLKIYQWNLWDTVETCPLATDSSGHITDTQEVYFETDDLGHQISTMVYKSCLSCPMLAGCKGQAKTSNAGSKAVVSLDDAKKLYTSLDASVWDAQVICIKPGSESMVYPMFHPEIHVIDYQTALKQKYGDDYDHIFDVEYEVYAGQDAGFICPATVFLQVIDDPETGDQLIIIFDELYEHNIAPSKYIREFLWPKHREYNVQEWFCDPSNSAQLMAEMEEQDLYPVEGLKSVDEGIDACRAAFSLGHLLIDKSCKNLIWELNRYEKNPNTGRPVKVDDHLVDAMRYGVNGVGLYQNVVDTIYT